MVLYLWPFLTTFLTSFQKVRGFAEPEFVGLDNYATLAKDDAFWQALQNSALYTVLILLGIPLATILAAAIQSVSRGRGVYRVLFFLPVVTLPVAVGMVWRFIFNGDYGLLNWVLSWFGIEGQYWLADERFTIWAFAVVGIWMGLGVNLIILGAGIQAIPPELYEAASLDGASRVRQFRSLTLPLLSPSIFFVSILTFISALQMFDLIFVMLRGVNNTALAGSKTIVYLFYDKTFLQGDKGYGATIAIVLLMIIMLVTWVQFRLQKRWVFYG